MALNQIAAFVNPANSKNKGGAINQSSPLSITAYTAVANDKISSFTITANCIGTAGTDWVTFLVFIGTGKYQFILNGATGIGASLIQTSDTLGFKGAFLQAGDVVTFQGVTTASAQWTGSISLVVDNYTQ